MRIREWFRSLLIQSVLGIVLPVALVTLGLIAAGLFAYQQAVTSLVIERDRQLAALIAGNVKDTIDGYTGVLEALAGTTEVQSDLPAVRAQALADAATALDIFSAGVIITDPEGKILTIASATGSSPVGPDLAEEDYFRAVRDREQSAPSSVLKDPNTGKDLIVIGVPMLDDNHKFVGVLLGGVYLRDATIGNSIKKLTIGDQGYAYLVDRRGRIIFHPDAKKIGVDYSDRPFVAQVISGDSGGALWTGRAGERMVEGYAPVPFAGWGMIVVEPWDAVVAPVQTYSVGLIIAGLCAIAVIGFLLWYGVRRITSPVQRLAEQTTRLAAGEAIEPIMQGGILEIDLLGSAFTRMAAQIASYRAGLQRYLGAITKSQEDERRHLARELHDETTQSLLAIARQVELYQASEGDSVRLGQLTELRTMLSETLRGLREISRDLRPLILEDLGLVPALEMLTRSVPKDDGVCRVNLAVKGTAIRLSAEQELALYRITQEALTNVRKHARATEAHVNLAFERTVARLVVSDNGQGFQAPGSLGELAQRGSFGLMGIQERVWAVGGSLSIQSAPGRGTQVTVTMPVENATD